MTATVWADVHAGDGVRGADGRVWTVAARQVGHNWARAGAFGRFVLRLGEGTDARELSTMRRLDEAVPIVARADHTGEAAAAGALIAAGLELTIMKEETVSTYLQKVMADSLIDAADHLTDGEQAAVSAPLAQVIATATGTPAVDPFTPPAPAQRPAEPETKRDRWGRYVLPDPRNGEERAWTRASTVARTLADEYGLTQWKLRMTARGVALRPDLIAGAAAADPDTDKGVLDGIVRAAMEKAEANAGANFGTAMHSFAQRLDRGESIASMGVPDRLVADLNAYVEALRASGYEVMPEYMERVVVVPDRGVAGTLDRIVRHRRTGALSILDLKTGKDLSYSWLEIRVQQAIYARATHVWDKVSKTYAAMPTVDPHRALVVHLPIGQARAQIYGVDITKGWREVGLALAVREARTDAKSSGAWLVEPDDPETVAIHNVSRAGQAELARLWETLNARGLWTEAVNAAAMARFAQIQAQQP